MTNSPLQAIRQMPPPSPPVSILMYHQVGPFPRPAAHRAVYCHVGRFRRQMAYLKFFGYNVISLEAAYEGLFFGKKLPNKAVVLTFDDGCENFREHAWPILKRHNFPATMFLVADLLGKTAQWMPAGEFPAPLMTRETVRALRREGVSFGSHTLTHPHLSKLSAPEMRREIFESKTKLEDLFGEPIPDFCYPYGDYDARTIDLAGEAGYRLGLTCIRAAANAAKNPFELPRKAISYGDTLPGYFWKLHMKNKPKK